MVLLNGIDFTDARTGHQSHSLPVDIDCISAVDLLDGVPGVGAFAGAVNIRTAPLKLTYLRFEGAGGQHGYAYANLSGAVTSGRFSLLAAGSYRPQRRLPPQYRVRQLQRFRACDLRGSPRRVLRPAGRLPEPHVRFQRLLCGL